MMEEYINLTLKQLSGDFLKETILDTVIRDNKLTVILGAPGSGKSSILKKYAKENSNCSLLKIKEFLHLTPAISKQTETLLLDGMDEYRSIATDKVFVTTAMCVIFK